MSWHQELLRVRTPGQGMHEITDQVAQIVSRGGAKTGLSGMGLCHVFVRHTSCSLLIQENADPTARHDLERWLARLAPEHDPDYQHTLEGPDDMPSHLRSAVTKTSETIPIVGGRLGLGTWQGLYLFEHRRHKSLRTLIVTAMLANQDGE